jgi:hypothetical protein
MWMDEQERYMAMQRVCDAAKTYMDVSNDEPKSLPINIDLKLAWLDKLYRAQQELFAAVLEWEAL